MTTTRVLSGSRAGQSAIATGGSGTFVLAGIGSATLASGSAGTADGSASVAGVSRFNALSHGNADGAASVAGVSKFNFVAHGNADGVASVSSAAQFNFLAYGVAQGFGNAIGIATPFAGVGAADGAADVEGVGRAVSFMSLTQGFRLHTAELFKWPVSLTQNLTAHAGETDRFIWGRILTQALTLHGAAPAAKATYHVTDSDVIRLAQVLRRATPVVLSQALTVHQSQALALALSVAQRLRLTPAATPQTSYHLALLQALLLDSTLGRFLGLHLSQALTAHADLSRHYVANPVLSQALSVHAGFASSLSLRLTSALSFTPAQVLHMVYRGDPLLDTIDLNALHVSPSGGATTWAINTRTGAVTQYSDYAFNAFTSMGLRYLAASSDGIYELDGDTDDGSAIVAEMQSGLMRLNATKLAGLKGAYLAVRGGGQFFLKIIAGDGREYIYQVEAQPEMMTTKVQVGKGLRTTFMAFNLKSTGQDFDLDSLEFIPMLSDRRV